MSNIRRISRESRELIEQALNGVISEEGLRQLDAALLDNPELQKFFLNHCQLHIDLTIEARAGQSVEEFRRRQERAVSIAPLPTVKPRRAAMPLLFGGTGSWAWAANGVLSLILIGIFWWATGNSQSPGLGGAALANRVDLPSVQTFSGTTKLLLPRIGYVIVDGPAELQMLDPLRARLTQGRIRVHVTEKTGYGFVVETPYGNVTDLGTEFGLDVPKDGKGKVGLVVFDGAVDLRVNRAAHAQGPAPVERLMQGEGVSFGQLGELSRIGSIVTGTATTFLQTGEAGANGEHPLIVSVSDNRDGLETKKFYEIVPHGLMEDAVAYADRQHQWNGITTEGMPPYLLNADYVRTFADEHGRRNLEVKVDLGRPADLYVFFDKRLALPSWLKRDFQLTGDRIGLDMAGWGKRQKRVTEVGPGNSINVEFDIWKRTVAAPGIVVLGSPSDLARDLGGMYGIAAVPLSPEKTQGLEASK